jgi:glyoxylate/hydroxypyruvate reductase
MEHILVVSPMYTQLQAFIEKENLLNQFRFIPEDELTQAELNWSDALVAFNLRADYDYSNVKWVHSLGAGVDRFLYKKAWNENVLLTRTICSFGQRIAEYCLSYILKDLQFHDQFRECKRQKKWQPMTPKLLSEQKVMIYGTGEIGQATAKVLAGLGMVAYGCSSSGKEKEFFSEVLTVEKHFSRLAKIDYVINTMPLTNQTADFFDERIFKQLSGAGFVNVGRGASVNEGALLEALDQNLVRFAVLDVFAEEPLPGDNPLWKHPNVIITPHISAVTTPEEGAACFLDTLNKIEEGIPLDNVVDVKKGY